MRSVTLVALLATALAGPVLAKLPALSDEAKAKAAEAAAKSAWADKVGAYKLCQSMDRVADGYRKDAKAAGKAPPAPAVAPASGAHSPSTMAVGPPSTKATAAQISPKK